MERFPSKIGLGVRCTPGKSQRWFGDLFPGVFAGLYEKMDKKEPQTRWVFLRFTTRRTENICYP